MGIFYFPCNFVYWRKVPNHKKLKDELMPIIDKSSIFQPTTSGFGADYFKDHPLIQSVVFDSINELVKILNEREGFEKTEIEDSVVTRWWYAKYDDKGGGCACHNHNPDSMQSHQFINDKVYRSTFTVVYIINDSNPQNATEFLQPSQLGINSCKSAQTLFRTSHVQDINEGTVLVFPSNLYHQVPQTETPGRVILSFDVSSIFRHYPKMGIVDYSKVKRENV